jgi:hypothetical protein
VQEARAGARLAKAEQGFTWVVETGLQERERGKAQLGFAVME